MAGGGGKYDDMELKMPVISVGVAVKYRRLYSEVGGCLETVLEDKNLKGYFGLDPIERAENYVLVKSNKAIDSEIDLFQDDTRRIRRDCDVTLVRRWRCEDTLNTDEHQ
ncbi:hypothetical protein J6590_006472 [Homalodisca vitripennis]|nr:hypothetical protein J6590_006472 [Homalodisca vitripennis]